MKLDKAILFSLTSNIEMVDKVSKILDIPIGHAQVNHFADGEIIAFPSESVRGRHVFIVQSTCPPVTEKLMELLIFIDSLKRASAKEITAILPYFGYARQDRKSKAREPITARLVADLLQTAGVNRVISFDFHTPQLQGFFSCPTDDVMVSSLWYNEFKRFKADDLVIVSPDHGGVGRARKLATALGASIAILDKRRSRANVAEIFNIIGEVKDKKCVLIDDIIDTAGTLVACSQALDSAGAKEIYACASHGLFSDPAIDRINNSIIKEVIITDTVPFKRDSDKIRVISVVNLLSRVIENVELGIPLSSIYQEK